MARKTTTAADDGFVNATQDIGMNPPTDWVEECNAQISETDGIVGLRAACEMMDKLDRLSTTDFHKEGDIKVVHPMIFKAIAEVMKDVGAVGKSDINKKQGFKYRGIDAVMNAMNPAMVKHNVFVTPEIIESNREDRVTANGTALIYSVCKIKYTFYTLDGSSVCATVIGEAMDAGDKSMNKAMSVAFKYALFQVFCIPTEEMIDPDSESHVITEKTSAPKPQQAAKPKASEQMNAEMIQSAEESKLTPLEIETIKSLVAQKGLTLEQFCNKPIETWNGKFYQAAIERLNSLKDANVKQKEEDIPFL